MPSRWSTDSDEALLASLDVETIIADHRASQEAASQEAASQDVASSTAHGAGPSQAGVASLNGGSLLPDDEDEVFMSVDVDAAIEAKGAVVRHPEFEAICCTNLLPGELMTIVAAAGSGKSTVLREYARQRPHLRILYLSYGRDVTAEKRLEFSAPGLNHVKVMTTHGFAYKHTMCHHRGKTLNGDFFVRSKSFEAIAGGKWTDETLAPIIETLARFAASTDMAIEDEHMPRSIEHAERPATRRAARMLWEALCDPARTDFLMAGEHYLKAFQLNKAAQIEALAEFDLVLLDEAHDCSAAQIDVLGGAHASPARIFVYDPHQVRYVRDVCAYAGFPCAVCMLVVLGSYV